MFDVLAGFGKTLAAVWSVTVQLMSSRSNVVMSPPLSQPIKPLTLREAIHKKGEGLGDDAARA
jgi:hypothetical protein